MKSDEDAGLQEHSLHPVQTLEANSGERGNDRNSRIGRWEQGRLGLRREAWEVEKLLGEVTSLLVWQLKGWPGGRSAVAGSLSPRWAWESFKKLSIPLSLPKREQRTEKARKAEGASKSKWVQLEECVDQQPKTIVWLFSTQGCIREQMISTEDQMPLPSNSLMIHSLAYISDTAPGRIYP